MNIKFIGIGALVLIALTAINGCSNYNGFMVKEEGVSKAYGQVQNVLQRQADLIPALVESVKGQIGHENKTLVGIAEARSAVSAIQKMRPEDIAKDPELQRQVIEASQKSMIAVNAVREAYPELRSSAQFATLNSQIEGSQNRITTERRNLLNVVQDYNISVRRIPGSLWAWIFGFEKKVQFEAEASAQKMPQVKF